MSEKLKSRNFRLKGEEIGSEIGNWTSMMFFFARASALVPGALAARPSRALSIYCDTIVTMQKFYESRI